MNYQAEVEKFMNPETLVSKDRRLLNAVLGLCGEAGETGDLLKKHLFHGHEFDREKFKKELSDVYFYLAEACSALDTTLNEIAMLNIAKLSARYPGGFTEEHSKMKLDEVQAS